MIRERAARCRLIGRLVRLQLARALVAALGEVPVLELAAKSGLEHQRSQVARRRRYAQAQLGEGLLLTGTLIVDHQMTAGRNETAHQLDDLGLETERTRIDCFAGRIIGYHDWKQPAFDPWFDSAS